MPNNLLLKIVKCDNIEAARNDESHPCYNIVNQQDIERFQPPEPWVGNIKQAKVIVIGTNPNLHEDENIVPGVDAEFNDIIMFYETSCNNNKCSYWTKIKNKLTPKFPGLNYPIDFMYTDIVHCRSKGGEGVNNSICKCVGYLDEIIKQASRATHIVLVGAIAKKVFQIRYSACCNGGEHEYGGRIFNISSLQHPNARVKASRSQNQIDP